MAFSRQKDTSGLNWSSRWIQKSKLFDKFTEIAIGVLGGKQNRHFINWIRHELHSTRCELELNDRQKCRMLRRLGIIGQLCERNRRLWSGDANFGCLERMFLMQDKIRCRMMPALWFLSTEIGQQNTKFEIPAENYFISIFFEFSQIKDCN